MNDQILEITKLYLEKRDGMEQKERNLFLRMFEQWGSPITRLDFGNIERDAIAKQITEIAAAAECAHKKVRCRMCGYTVECPSCRVEVTKEPRTPCVGGHAWATILNKPGWRKCTACDLEKNFS